MQLGTGYVTTIIRKDQIHGLKIKFNGYRYDLQMPKLDLQILAIYK